MQGANRGERDLRPGPARDLVDLFRLLRSGRPRQKLQVIAEKSGKSRAHISEVLRGWKYPSPDTAQAIATALGADERTALRARRLAEKQEEITRYVDPGHQPLPGSGAAQGQLARSVVLPRSPGGPARLLDPGRGVVDFTGRAAELAALLAWCQEETAGRLRLVTGAGGVGKTRLALQLARQLGERGWRCEWVGDREEGRILAAVRAVTSGRVLLVVDYAETRLSLLDLLRDVVTDNGAAIRILLLARSAGQWWEQLSAGEGAIRDLAEGAGPEGLPLGAVLDEQLTDEEQFRAAVPVFAAALGTDPPGYVAVTTPGRRARVLELHAAALVAVLEWIAAPGLPVRIELAGALGELLKHEERFWLGAAHALRLDEGPAGMTPRLLRQVVAAGCLLGAAGQDEAVALLGRVPGATGSVKVAEWLRELYPPEDGSTEWLGSVQPDRLAERLVVRELSGSAPLARACLASLDERQARRAIFVLARAATEDDIAERLLGQLLPLVARVVEEIRAPLEVLVAISNSIPYPSVILAGAHAAITHRILDTPETATHPAEQARWLTVRGTVLNQLGRPAEALAVTQRAVGMYRELADVNPGRFRPELAHSLANLGAWLSKLHRPREALPVEEEAASIRRELAAANPERYRPDLATSLGNLGATLSDLGRQTDAMPVEEEAASIRRELAQAHPERYRADLGTSLSNVAVTLAELGRPEDALPAAQEAAAIFRDLAATEPDRHRPDLARTLTSLGLRLSELDRPADALPAEEEGAAIYRELATANPGLYRHDLAVAVANLGIRLLDLGRPAEALPAMTEAVAAFRELAAAAPDRYRPDLAQGLANLGAALSDLKRPEDALAAGQEAVNIRRELATADPGRYQPDLAATLTNLGTALWDLERPEDALAAEQEAVDLYRELATGDPGCYQPRLATSLVRLGGRFSAAGRPAEALAAEQEAVNIRRELATAAPRRYRPDLADALANLGITLTELDRPAEALAAAREAVSIRRELATADPGGHRRGLGSSLGILSLALSKLGREADALAAAREAVSVSPELAGSDQAG